MTKQVRLHVEDTTIIDNYKLEQCAPAACGPVSRWLSGWMLVAKPPHPWFPLFPSVRRGQDLLPPPCSDQ